MSLCTLSEKQFTKTFQTPVYIGEGKFSNDGHPEAKPYNG